MDKKVLTIVILSVVLAGASAFGIWSFINYRDQKSDVDSRVDIAVAEARKQQADLDETKFSERENATVLQFVGPEDYGQLTFTYPRAWSVYEHKDGTSGGVYEAYFHPSKVPQVKPTERFALRVLIESKDYDKVLATYDSAVAKGDLSSSSVSVNDRVGTRLDGDFSKDIRGSAVLFKVRDKTLTIRTDANTFKDQFDALIKTIDFRQ